MKYRDREMVPRVLVRAMFGLMGLTVALVGYAQWADVPLTGVAPDSPVVEERAITLTGDRRTGYSVIDAAGAQIAHSTDDKKGFIDVIATSVNRERTVKGITENDPLRLVRRENGHVAVIDPASGWKIELIGYGKDNVAAFATLLD
ncbi:MAG: photosynthetic complex assembly protein PuhC [Litoreibacter sp.]|nr:photosynthetic complex assembly protein PuhC [Litoreibacter sp.]